MESKKEEVIDITASTQIHSFQPHVPGFSGYRHVVGSKATGSSSQELSPGGGGGWEERRIHKQVITRQCDDYNINRFKQVG